MIKRVNKFIAPEIYKNISLNTRISSIVSECIPDNLASHTECIGSEDKTLSLATQSAAIGSQLRFYSDAMLTALHNEGFTHFKRIRIVTNHFNNITQASEFRRSAKPPPALSERTTQLIRSTARSIDDVRLKKAMEKLAEIGESNQRRK